MLFRTFCPPVNRTVPDPFVIGVWILIDHKLCHKQHQILNGKLGVLFGLIIATLFSVGKRRPVKRMDQF